LIIVTDYYIFRTAPKRRAKSIKKDEPDILATIEQPKPEPVRKASNAKPVVITKPEPKADLISLDDLLGGDFASSPAHAYSSMDDQLGPSSTERKLIRHYLTLF
jgi:hypothetical protein